MEFLLTHDLVLRWLAVLLVLALALEGAFQPIQAFPKRVRIWLFTGSVFLALFIWRYPFMVYPAELNVDESQTLATARIFCDDPVPWRSADTTTSGPFNTYIYLWTRIFGYYPDYFSKRLTAVFLGWGALVFLFLSARRLLNERTAYLCILPVVWFYVFPQELDFVHASTEFLPVFLISFGLFLAIRCLTAPDPRKLEWLLCGLILGLVPFAKLQGAPLAAVVGLVLIVGASRIHGWISQQSVLAVVGSIIPAMFISIWTLDAGCFDDMWLRSFHLALTMKGDRAYLGWWGRFEWISRCNAEFVIFFPLTIGLLIGAIVDIIRSKSPGRILLPAGALVWIIIGIYIIIKSGSIFPHYLLFMAAPLAMGIIAATRQLPEKPAKWPSVLFILPTALFFLPALTRVDIHQQVAAASLTKPDLRDELSKFISTNMKPGEYLGIWGWTPRYFVETSTRSATRDLVSYLLLIDTETTSKYRTAYTADMIKNRPRIFIDTAVDKIDDPRFPTVDEGRHTCHPPLHKFIETHYNKIGEFTPPGKSAAIWIYQIRE